MERYPVRRSLVTLSFGLSIIACSKLPTGATPADAITPESATVTVHTCTGPYLPEVKPDYSLWQPDELTQATSFTHNDRLVMTNYYYWYDVNSGNHVAATGRDALRYHPLDVSDFSFNSDTWHARELGDMITAGIDILLPVYWGVPCQDGNKENRWSDGGLVHLVRATDALAVTGKKPPKIGMLHDTNALQLASPFYNHPGGKIDLTTVQGKVRFYQPIANFFHIVPPRLWAQVDNRPIVVIGSRDYVSAYDASLFTYVRESFARDFGRAPYLIVESPWLEGNGMAGTLGGLIDGTYDGDGARRANFHSDGTSVGIAALGPGYFNVTNENPDPDRKDGKFYQGAWEQTLKWGETQNNNHVLIFTWDELHDGTNINDTQEFGRTYIDLTAAYACRFKRHDGCPAISQQQKAVVQNGKIAFLSDRDGNPSSLDLFVMDADGTNLVKLTHDQGAKWLGYTWSPDGKRIAYQYYHLNLEQQSDYGNNPDLYVVGIDGSQPVFLTKVRVGPGTVLPQWSPSGQEIAYWSGDAQNRYRPCMINVETKNTHCLKDVPAIDSPSWAPQWSPDGKRLAFDTGSGVYVADIDGANAHELVPGLSGDWPKWSADNVHIAFGSFNDRIYIANADGSGSVLVQGDAGGTRYAWSPDGSQLAMMRDSDVYVVSADGTLSINLTHKPGQYQFMGLSAFGPWSPDGKYLAVSDLTTASVLHVDGLSMTNLPVSWIAGWTLDSAHLVAGSTSCDDGFEIEGDLLMITADGSTSVNLTRHPGTYALVIPQPTGGTLSQTVISANTLLTDGVGVNNTVPPTPLNGQWADITSQGPGEDATMITLKDCTVGVTCGTVDYMDLLCGGTLAFQGLVDSTYVFQEHITYDNQQSAHCVSGIVTLTQMDGRAWRYDWHYSWPGESQASGTLR
jgi:Tol biopolymer transport system component